MTIKHLKHYGNIAFKNETRPGPVPRDFTVNSPVGICLDNFRNLWLCDTGNNRILILDSDLSTILHIINSAPMGEEEVHLLLPFHLCHHPKKQQMILTDMGNGRAIFFDYAKSGDGYRMKKIRSFGYHGDGLTDYGSEGDSDSKLPSPLGDPNGITMVREEDGLLYIYINDEFQYSPEDPKQLNRCVRFTEDGKYDCHFRQVKDPGEKDVHDLIWPQGLASDDQGNLYIANTGCYEIIRCNLKGENVEGSILLHSFGDPDGMGSLNILRSVSVIDGKVFVPDQKANTITVYDPATNKQFFVTGLLPGWDHDQDNPDSLTDFMFVLLENSSLSSPYQICKGDEPGTYFITEPFISRVVKVKIPTLERDCRASLVTALGDRRDLENKDKSASQFNSVTSVLGLTEKVPSTKNDWELLPDYLRYNPFYLWFLGASNLGMGIYETWYDTFFKPFFKEELDEIQDNAYCVDAGNWIIKSYDQILGQYKQERGTLKGFYIPGNVGIAAFHPEKPPAGQLCPGTPILFVTNFTLSLVTMYQFTPMGKIINYGVPFGFRGDGDFGAMMGPQGLAIDGDGKIFIADSLNHRISQWQLLPTGQVVFIKNIYGETPEESPGETGFYPTDVAIDQGGRLFVSDQFNNRIRVFDGDGNPLWSYGKRGYCNEKNIDTHYDNFILPASLCIDGDHLIVNDLVNRYLKVFKIKEKTLEFVDGKALFKDIPENGGLWMPYLMYAHNRHIHVPDATYNVVNVYEY
ncbi:MAG: hypothetical protein GY737_30430 [Desulfobacteraceae bacterium]|nr:hypothetical protein [Desulfobacteraceae bacterium]